MTAALIVVGIVAVALVFVVVVDGLGKRQLARARQDLDAQGRDRVGL